MKYRKKPVIVEAWQYLGGISIASPQWVQDAWSDRKLYFSGKKLFVRSWESDMLVSPNDYVIKGVMGELYPCKPVAFRETYEPVREGKRA